MNVIMPQRAEFKKAIAFQKGKKLRGFAHRPKRNRCLKISKTESNAESSAKSNAYPANANVHKVNEKTEWMNAHAQQSQTMLNGITHIWMTNTMTFMRVLSTQCYHH